MSKYTYIFLHIMAYYRILNRVPCTIHENYVIYFVYSSLYLGEGNGTPLQYSCLENPWAEEPGRLQSMGSLRVRHDWATSLSLFTFMHWRRKWQPTPVFLPGDSQGRGSLVGCCLWGRTESDTTEVTKQQQQQQQFVSANLKLLIYPYPCLSSLVTINWFSMFLSLFLFYK